MFHKERRAWVRALAFFLCTLLTMGSVSVAVPVAAAADVSIQSGTGNRSPIRVGESLGYRAIVNAPFTGFGFAMPTWNTTDSSCTISLYAWKGTFAKTVAEAPLASADFNPLRDNSVNRVTFDEMPAGEYLFHIGNVSGQVGVWTNTEVSGSKGFFYENGMESQAEPELTVTFTERPAEPFGVCQPSAEARIPQMPVVGNDGDKITQLNSSVGMQLDMTAPFVGAEFKLGTYMILDLKATVSLYRWDRDYDTTVASMPVAEERITLRDNVYQGITFDKQPAGKYLLLLHDTTGTTALYCHNTVKQCLGIVYKDGYAMEVAAPEYPQCRVVFAEDKGTEPYFLPIDSTDSGIDGKHTPPPAYVIPEDSLLYTHKVQPDTWVFTDGLGRVSLTNAEVGDPREDKTLAMFFWTWHLSGTEKTPRNNLQQISEKYPEAIRDYQHPVWSSLPSSFFGWNESIYGNYRSDDGWVLRRQAELLANAGVDVVFTDNTNGTNTWRIAYTELLRVWDDAQRNGAVNVPKLSFMLPFGANDYSKQQLYSLYLDVFRAGKYPNMWFYWEGKPMLMAHKTNLSASASNTEKEILNFFTFRANYPGYINPSPAPANWGWLSTYPQAVYYASQRAERENTPEQITVGVAQNHDAKLGLLAAMSGNNIMGRSYTSKGYHTEEGAKLWGYNFSEQFDHALTIDPKVVFVTGWNEWQVGRYDTWPEGSAAAVENAFPDQFNDEYSRDIEPSKGDLQDHYYYLLVNYARKYKGAAPIPTPGAKMSIDMGAGAEQWKNVEPYYAAYIGNTGDRGAQGYGVYYTETSGRNDIIGAQVARDDDYVYFHVECAADITSYTDPLWMNLYLDTDQAKQGWNTFDYVVGKTPGSADTLVLERFTADNDYTKTERVADVVYTVDGRYMTVKIAKADLGLSGFDFTVNFAWTDNVHDEGDYSAFSGDIMDFYIAGDVAPGGRFKFSYISTAANAGGETETDPDTAPVSEPSDNGTTATEPIADPATETEGTAPKSGCKSALGLSAATAALCSVLCGAVLALRRRDD